MQSCVRTVRPALARCAILASLAMLFLLPGSVAAEKTPAAAPVPTYAAINPDSEDDKEAESDQDTPRRALERFLAQTSAGDYFKAAEAIPVSSTNVGDAAEKARRLALVIERRMNTSPDELAKVSDLPAGNQTDGLKHQDVIGRIDMPLGSETIRLQRQGTPGQRRWVF